MLEILNKENIIKAICTGYITIKNDFEGNIYANVYNNNVYFNEEDMIMDPVEYLSTIKVSNIADLLIETLKTAPYIPDGKSDKTLISMNRLLIQDLPMINLLWLNFDPTIKS